MRKATSFRPTVEALEDRLTPATFTLVNKSTHLVFLQLSRHYSGSNDIILGDGTSLGTSVNGLTEWAGSFPVAPGAHFDIDSGDDNLVVRVQQQPNGKAIALSGPGVSEAATQFVSKYGYSLMEEDGSNYVDVRLHQTDYGPVFLGDLARRKGQSLGVTVKGGFYSVPTDYTITIRGPLAITGVTPFSFPDYCGSTDSKWIDHMIYAPHGAHIYNYNYSPDANRGDNIHFDLDPHGRYLHEYGTISGGGLFQYGGAYVVHGTIDYAY
jgi:hypothetical protein